VEKPGEVFEYAAFASEIKPNQARARVREADWSDAFGPVLAAHDVQLAKHWQLVAFWQVAAHPGVADRTLMPPAPPVEATQRGPPALRHHSPGERFHC